MPKIDVITNRQMSRAVTNLTAFRNNNHTVYSEDRGDLYVVYSYGDHFPMYVYDYASRTWFGNDSKYSSTTSRHQSLARPRADEIEWMDTHTMRTLIRAGGYAAYCARRCMVAA